MNALAATDELISLGGAEGWREIVDLIERVVGGKRLSSRTYSILWCITYYFVMAFASACQPFIFDANSFTSSLSSTAIALPAAYWMINDAKLRGLFVPHVIQPWIVLFWVPIVPIYLVKTRKWWGLLYVALHFVCTLVVAGIANYLSIVLIWPIVFPDYAW